MLLQSGEHSEQHIPGMPYANPAPYWQQPQGPGIMHAGPQHVNQGLLPQHLTRRSQSHPPVAPPLGAYGPYQQRQQPPAFGLHLHPQQEQQALEAQAQAQLHQALESQARQAAGQQMHPQQHPAAGSMQQPGDRSTAPTPFGAGFGPPRWPGAGASDQRLASQQASEQQRRLAELLASNHLHNNEPGLLRQASGVQQQPGYPSQQPSGPGADLESQEQAHRLASWGAVSAPEQMYHLNSLGAGSSAEQAYRLSSLGGPGEALLAFREGANQGRPYATSQTASDSLSGNLPYSGNQYGQ